MDWQNQFRKLLCSNLDKEWAIIETEKTNSNFLIVLKHINPIKSENLISILKLTYREYFRNMEFDLNEALPGIDGTTILENFNYDVLDILKGINLFDTELAYRIFLRNYLNTFGELILKYEDYINTH
jgi:hypothetical protein